MPPAERDAWHRWYTNTPAADLRSRATSTQADDSLRYLFTGTLHSDIVFENLTEEDLGSLIAAIDPGRLLRLEPLSIRYESVATHLGGGKPLGLGSVRPEIMEMTVWDSRRYFTTTTPDADDGTGGAEEPAESTWTQEEIDQVVVLFSNNHREALHDQWEALAHILDLRKIDPNLMGYPPGVARTQFALDQRGFDESFRFFSHANGDHSGKLVPLPVPTKTDQTLPIDPRHPRGPA